MKITIDIRVCDEEYGPTIGQGKIDLTTTTIDRQNLVEMVEDLVLSALDEAQSKTTPCPPLTNTP